MIFVTVGTHEQQFNRLIKKMDELVENGTIKEKVYIQIGFSTYKPKHCDWSEMLGYEEMNKMIQDSRIIITHGGPASFIAPLQVGKIPIVVPRKYELEEHVNNHQIDFVKQVSERLHNIIPIFDIDDLEDAIKDYDNIAKKIKKNNHSNNKNFCKKLEEEVDKLFKK